MIASLEETTSVDFGSAERRHGPLIATIQLSIQESAFWGELAALYERLAGLHVAGKIRGVESWADGTNSLRSVGKSWDSTIDKLYRMNIEENERAPQPPSIRTVKAKAQKGGDAPAASWVTPVSAPSYIDDLVRTKFVVPFVDGVVQISDDIVEIAKKLGLQYYKRYHAKDSGYHARHIYVLLPISALAHDEGVAALEIKVLTKTQDTLGELTHLLYERKRTGSSPTMLKRKLAWEFQSPDFTASYVGHTSHLIEVMFVNLKAALHSPEGENHG